MTVLAVLAVIVLAASLFPIRIRLGFSVTKRRAFLSFKFFKFRKFHRVLKKTFGKDIADENVDETSSISSTKISQETEFSQEIRVESAEVSKSAEVVKEPFAPSVSSVPPSENAAQKADAVVANDSDSEKKICSEKATDAKTFSHAISDNHLVTPSTAASDAVHSESIKSPQSSTDDLTTMESSKEFSDKDFFTIILQDSFWSAAWKHAIRLLKAAIFLFTIKFSNARIRGLSARTPAYTGYWAACTAFLFSTVPVFDGWQIEWDWCKNQKLRVCGICTCTFNVARLLLLLAVAAYAAACLAVRYFYQKRIYRKEPERFELSFVSRQIVKFLAED